MRLCFSFLLIFSFGLLSNNAKADLCLYQFPEQTFLERMALDKEKPEFRLSYTHSVALSKVEDQYIIKAGQIIQTSESVADHGAGLPSMSNEPDLVQWRFVDERFILDMHRVIDKLVVRVNPEYENRLYSENQISDITQWGRMAIEIKLCSG